MDWNLKSQLSWDFTDFEQQQQQQQQQIFTNSNNNNTDDHNVSNIFTIDHQPTREDRFDLKLGRVPNSGSNETFPKMPSSSSSPGPTKRSRGSYNSGSQLVSCLVDGCEADLSGCRDYHRRHKVCELHSKTPKVTIAGHYQRFCQQCSRFHGLEEFDEGKRSCRKRLDGHNRRRRKPQPEPFSRYGNLLSNYQGNQLLPFPSSVMYSSPTSVDPTSAGVVIKTEAIDLPKNSLFLNSSLPAKPFSLFQSHHHHHHHHHDHNHNNHSFVRANNITVEDHHNQPGSRLDLYGKLSSSSTSSAAIEVQNSECVLSLLSTSAQITEMGLGHSNNNSSNDDVSNQIGSIPLIHSVGLDQMSSVLAGNGNELHYLGMFRHTGSDGSSNQDSHHQTLPSNWG